MRPEVVSLAIRLQGRKNFAAGNVVSNLPFLRYASILIRPDAIYASSYNRSPVAIGSNTATG